MSSIAAALAAARLIIPPAEARLLARHLLGCTPAWLEAHRDEALDAAQAEAFAALHAARAAEQLTALESGGSLA